jgi:hypothetical protein
MQVFKLVKLLMLSTSIIRLFQVLISHNANNFQIGNETGAKIYVPPYFSSNILCNYVTVFFFKFYFTNMNNK